MTIRERVAKGAAFLDEERSGWREEISLFSLSIRHCRDCILGQLYGWFFDGLIIFDGTSREARWDSGEQHGFCYPDGTDNEEIDALQSEWIEQIKKGRSE